MSDTRVYGNRYGTWIEFSGEMAEAVAAACNAQGITPQEFVDRALAHYLEAADEPE